MLERNRASLCDLLTSYAIHFDCIVRQSKNRVRRSVCGNVSTDDERDANSQDFDGSQHFLMRRCGDTYLECDARDASASSMNLIAELSIP